MVARGAGEVGCAHCTKFGARLTCRVCKLQVCETCAADWTTCSEPAGRELRLGIGWRLRDVDPKGRLALVSHMLRAPRIIDLRRLRWLGAAPLGLNMYNAMRLAPPRLTSDGLLVHPDLSLVTGDVAASAKGVRWHELESLQTSMIVDDVEGPHGCTTVSATDDVYAYATDTQRVVVMRHVPFEVTQPYRFISQSVEPLPRKVISAIAFDGERGRLAAATWREIAIHHVHAGNAERLVHFDTGIDANITFLALTGRWIAFASASRFEVRAVEADGSVGHVAFRHGGHVEAAALSRDGAFLAIALGSRLLVHDLETFTHVEFIEHSDGINYVRFASDDHTLISGDNDNRIVMRPRTEAGYAKQIVEVELTGER